MDDVPQYSPPTYDSPYDFKPSDPQPALQEEFKGLPVRVEGDKIFLLKNGKKHWISSAEALMNLGFKFGDEVKIDQATLNALPEAEPIR